jgi:hypothetical protein
MSLKPETLYANAPVFADAPIRGDSGGDYVPGEIVYANSSRLVETFYSAPLTSYAVGWKDPNDAFDLLEFIAPTVPVGRRFEWKKANNSEEFLSETFDDQRAEGSDFKRVEYTSQDVTDKTINKGLSTAVDLDQATGEWELATTAKLLRRLRRNELRRGFAALTAAAVNTNKVWGNGSDPDVEVINDLAAAASVTGVRPNRVLYGDEAYNYRRGAFRAQDNPGAYASADLNPAELASLLTVDRVAIARARYQSTGTAKTNLVGNRVMMFFALDGVDTDDPTNIKRFATQFTPEQEGGYFRVYRQQLSAKLVLITVEHYSKIVVTFSGGVRQLTVSPS